MPQENGIAQKLAESKSLQHRSMQMSSLETASLEKKTMGGETDAEIAELGENSDIASATKIAMNSSIEEVICMCKYPP